MQGSRDWSLVSTSGISVTIFVRLMMRRPKNPSRLATNVEYIIYHIYW